MLHQGLAEFFIDAVIATFVGIGQGGSGTLLDTDVIELFGMSISMMGLSPSSTTPITFRPTPVETQINQSKVVVCSFRQPESKRGHHNAKAVAVIRQYAAAGYQPTHRFAG